MSSEERIGNGERESAIAALRVHQVEGRLESTEYEDRSIRARQARTWADLDSLFSDLPEPHPAPGVSTRAVAHDQPLPAPPPAPGPAGPQGQDYQRRGGLLPEPYAWMTVSIVPLLAVILFFSTGDWEWFLAIPIAGILVYGPDGRHGRDRNRNRNQRDY